MPARKQLSLDATDLAEDALLPRHEKLEIPERVALMIYQEENDYRCIDYLDEFKEICRLATKPVDEDCRVKMCEWCYQVVDFCKFRRETVGIGMSYLDRYLCSRKGRRSLSDRKEYQLVAMTCLYIAIKIHEPLEMETSLLADLSRGCYTEMEFANMEKKILEALVWRVSGPTPLAFAQNLMLFLPESLHSSIRGAIFDYARHQTELAIADHSFVKIKPSVTGLAAILNAMEGMDYKLFPPMFFAKFINTVTKYTTIDIDEVEVIQVKLSMIMLNSLSEEEKKKMEDAIDDESDGEYETPKRNRSSSRTRRNSLGRNRSRSPFSSPSTVNRKSRNSGRSRSPFSSPSAVNRKSRNSGSSLMSPTRPTRKSSTSPQELQ